VLATRPHSAGPQLRTPEGQCLGRHELEYALLPDGDALDDVELLRESQDYRCGFLTVPARLQLDPPLTLEGDVVFSCLKGADDGDGLILRCFNPSDLQTQARVTGDVTISRTRLDETHEEPIPDRVVRLRPGQIATLRLRQH
jgi:alpha-mannosidase